MKRWAARVLGTAVGIGIIGGAMAREATPVPAIGTPAPPQLGKDGGNDVVDLSAYRGKVVIVTFWASWCTYCRKELPALNDLQVKVGDQWLKVIAVNVQDATPEYRAMTRQMRDYKLVLARDKSGDIAARYGVEAYPNLWMIDPQGNIASHHVGYGEESLGAIIGEIKRLLTLEMQRQQQAKAATQD
jgi:thiol-disulfide isomerase/thioredoxin